MIAQVLRRLQSAGARRERGAVMMIGGASMAALIMVAALVVDLGNARTDRARNQIVTDSAAAAAAVGLVEGGGPGACRAALGYVEAHLGPVGGALTGFGCFEFPWTCQVGTPVTSLSGSIGDRTLTITHPVNDLDSMMTATVPGNRAQPVVEADGDRCERVGVRLSEPRSSFFSRIVNVSAGSTAVHSVALAGAGEGDDAVINLLVLDPADCDVLSIGGGGSSGQIVVGPVTDPITGETSPGRITSDSDGTGAGCSNKGILHTNGSAATIRADGPSGCGNELLGIGLLPGAGCGRIETYAPSTGPGCSPPACAGSGLVTPFPSRALRRYTRSQIDHRYNCKAVYPDAIGIDGCEDAGVRAPHIDDLIYSAEFLNSFDLYTEGVAGEGFDCRVNNGDAPVVVPVGNWIVDCSDLRISNDVVFLGGNIIFEGDVSLQSQGSLRINTLNTSTFFWNDSSTYDYRDHSAEAAFVYMAGGSLSKAGGASLELNHTFMYMSNTSEFDFSGGDGEMIWTAPTTGPFEDLALWSDSDLDHKFAGQASLELEGIVFAPYAQVVYTGNGSQQSVNAQFITRKVSVSGNGSFELTPKTDRAISFPQVGDNQLIR